MTQHPTTQQVVFGSKAQEGMLAGAKTLAQAVGSTMGPSGHNVIIERNQGFSTPLVTKDGVTVAKAIKLKNPLERVGAELLKEIASKTNEMSGDGTTSSVVLGYSLLSEGIKMISSGRSAIGLKHGMDVATTKLLEVLKQLSVPVSNKEDIVNIGTISANGDRQIGELLADAIEKVTANGIITIEPAKSFQTTLEVVEGMQFGSGYVSPYFVNNQEKNTVEFVDAFVLITNKKLTTLTELIPLLEKIANANKPVVVIGDEIEGEALHTLIVNKMRGVLNVVGIKAPSYGENRQDILQDIATVTGGTVFDASNPVGLKGADLCHLGSCKKIIVTRHTTTIVGSSDESLKANIESRIQNLRSVLEQDMTLDELRANNYKTRLAKLAGGVAIIRVGGSTEPEILEKKDRVEDALNATIAATQEGIIPGGGTALFYASLLTEAMMDVKSLTEDEQAGFQCVLNAAKAPLAKIVTNTGKNEGVVSNKLTEHLLKETALSEFYSQGQISVSDIRGKCSFGYDAARHVYGDLLEKGIIDPVKVPRYAIEHAVGVVGLMLTCNAVVISNEENKEETLAEDEQ